MPKHLVKITQKFEQFVEIDCPGDHLDACVLASKRLGSGELTFDERAAHPVAPPTIEPTYKEPRHAE